MYGVAGVPPQNSDDRQVERDAAERHDRKLAELLLPMLFASVAQLPQDPMGGASFEESSADGWRSGANAMTPNTASLAVESPVQGGVESAAAGGSPVDRVVARIDAGELGTIRLTIERTDAGVTVQVAAEDPVTAACAMLERATLEQALRAAGVNIASISVISGTGGTDLAQSTISQRINVLDTKGDKGSQQETPGARRRAKRLNLTG
jgi:hypothetical protein